MSRFDGQVVLITGASRGIGAAAARAFAQNGAHVVVAARSAGALDALVSDIEAAGGSATAVACDVADYAQVAAMVETACSITGRLDVYIGNAGVIEPIARLEESDPKGWTQAFRVNAEGIYFGLRAVLPVMRAQGGGTIINISSGAAYNALEGWSHYCASKAAARMLTEAAHMEAGDVVRVLGLSPGTVATQMQREIAASGINPVSQIDWEDHIPADWPARALIWMCGPEADTYRGQDVKLREEDVRHAIGLI
jgi:NAD(P)-dependent dehydrogenase (short-subunit alcohol dehydrogenase family)